ncbi:Riboflavin biosynthesis protein RibD [Senna tora]|uniref:Riboflavin biosynthesis protein RibD n=1 Tax=Senna tora TaxID=362788 RepID=A0A834W222_9FABA|nr:Riboflavin biosynthesis protein RibD [Senna tora]
MWDHVTISEQHLLKTPSTAESSQALDIVIPIEEIAAAMEEEEEKKRKTSPSNVAAVVVEGEELSADSKEDDDVEEGGVVKGKCRYCHEKDYVNATPLVRYAARREEEEYWRIPGTNIRIYSPLEVADMASARFCAAMNEDCNFRHPTAGVIFGFALFIVSL